MSLRAKNWSHYKEVLQITGSNVITCEYNWAHWLNKSLLDSDTIQKPHKYLDMQTAAYFL